jgi:hypothetical protein
MVQITIRAYLTEMRQRLDEAASIISLVARTAGFWSYGAPDAASSHEQVWQTSSVHSWLVVPVLGTS